MAHKKHPLTPWLRLTVSVTLALGLVVGVWLFPITAGTVVHIPLPTALSRSAGINLSLPFGAALVYATNGLTITKSAPNVVEIGEPITYTLSITNATTDPLTRAIVADTLPLNTACGSPPYHREPTSPPAPRWGFSCNPASAGWGMLYHPVVFPISFTVGSRNDLIFAVNLTQPVPDGYKIVNGDYFINAAGPSSVFSDTGLSVTTTVHAPAWGITKTVSSLVTKPGDYLTYTITISNIGRAATRGAYTLTEILPANTVSTTAQTEPPASQNDSTLTWVFTDTLAPDQSKTITCAVQVTSPLTDGVEIVNQTYAITGGYVYSTATGAPVTTTVVSSATLVITKIASVDPVQVGDWLTYTLTVTHAPTSNGAAFGVVISDTLPGEVVYQSAGFLAPASGTVVDSGDPLIVWRLTGPLAVGDSARVTVTVRVTSPYRPAIITNTFAVSATNAPVVAHAITTAVTSTNIITLSKSVLPAAVSPGDVVTYTITLTNTGNNIADITLADLLPPGFTPTTFSRSGLTLPGRDFVRPAVVTTTVFTAVTPLVPGVYYNQVVTTTYDLTRTTISQVAPVHVVLAAITLTKTSNVAMAHIGEVITYTYTITNSGDITLTNITLTDNRLGTIAPAITTLEPTSSTTGTAIFLVTEGHLPGPITNTAVVTGTYLGVNQVTTSTMASVAITYTTRLSVTKTAQPALAYSGDTITYTYRVTNTGSVTLYTISLYDDRLGAATVTPAPPLGPGDAATALLTTTVIEANLPGPLTNTVTVTGVNTLAQTTVATAAASVPLTYTTAISVLKTAVASAGWPAGPGDIITYTYRVTNTGTITLYTISLYDNRLGATTVTPVPPLGPGDAATAILTTTIIEANLPGPLTNTVAVTGVNVLLQSIIATDSLSVPLTYTARLALNKSFSASGGVPARIGDTITYTYRLTNTGSVTLTTIVLRDNRLGAITVPTTTLRPGAWTQGVGVVVINESNLPGPLTNTAAVTGVNTIVGQNAVATAAATVPLTYTADIALTKTANRVSAMPGDTITYTYSITNTGDITLYTVTLVDDKLGAQTVITPPAQPLWPGRAITVTQSTVVTEGQLPGPLVNTAAVTGTTTLAGVSATAADTTSVALTYTTAISLQKTADVASATLGQVIAYTYRFANSGRVSLNDVHIVDDKLGQVYTSTIPMSPGSFTLVLTSYTVTPADFVSNYPTLTNTATITGADYSGHVVTDTALMAVSLVYTPDITLMKTANVATAAPGQTITYTYRVTNTGNVTLTGLTLVDDQTGVVTVSPDPLPPYSYTLGTATYAVTALDLPAITNTATVTGSDSLLGQVVTDTQLAVVQVEALLTAITATNSSPNIVYATTFFTVTTNITDGVTYTWNFGDGSSGGGANPMHIFTTVGTYTVVVTAANQVSSLSTTTVVTITPGPLDHFNLTAVSPQTVGISFPITITAVDQYNNLINTFNQTVTISDTTGTIAPTSVTLVNGITITNFTVFSATVDTIQAISDTITGSTVVTIRPGAPTTLTLVIDPGSIRICQTAVATAALTDNWLNPVPNQAVSIVELGGSFISPVTPGSGNTNAAGVFTVTFRGMSAGSATIVAQYDGFPLVLGSLGVNSPPVPNAITVTASPGTVVVNNTTVAQAQVGSCVGPVSGAVVTFTVGSLASIVPPGTATTNAGGVATMTVTAGATPGVTTITGTVEGLLTRSTPFTITPATAPVLTITKRANPASGGQVYPGGAIVYNLIVSNAGTAPATGLVITDTLAAGVGFVGGTISSGSGPVNNGGVVTFTVPSLNNGASVSATIQVTVTAVTSGTLLNNTATAGSSQTAPVTSNLVTHRVITHTGGLVYLPIIMKNFTSAPDLISSFTINPPNPISGQPVVVTVIITNVGNAPTGAGFWVDFYIDPNPVPTVANQRWDALGSNVSPKQGIAWAIPTPGLAPGASIVLTSDGSGGGLAPSAPHSVWSGHFFAGTNNLYIYADSFSADGSPNGGILESNETNNRSELHGLSVTGLDIEPSGLPDPAQLTPRWEP